VNNHTHTQKKYCLMIIINGGCQQTPEFSTNTEIISVPKMLIIPRNELLVSGPLLTSLKFIAFYVGSFVSNEHLVAEQLESLNSSQIVD